MKCKYPNCKLGGKVEKVDAIKVGQAYYHKECHAEKILKKEIETYYQENMPKTTFVVIRKVVKKLMEEYNFSAEYIYFVLRYIHKNKKVLNSPFGLISYCTTQQISNEYKKIQINKKYEELGSTMNEIEDKEVTFTYKPCKRVTDII